MSGEHELKRAVVDLNLFVSGLISRLGLPFQLIERLRQDQFILVTCPQLRHELDGVLRREKFTVRYRIRAEIRDELLDLIDTRAIIVTPHQSVPIAVRDPKDEIVLATALAGNADYIVTGDEDLLVLNGEPAIGKVQIVTVREFLSVLEASPTNTEA